MGGDHEEKKDEEEEAMVTVTDEEEQFAILVKKIKNKARVTGIWWSIYFKFSVLLMMLCVQVPNHRITTKGYIVLYGVSIVMYICLWAYLLSNEWLLNMTFDRVSSSASLQPGTNKSSSLMECDITYIKCLYVPTWIWAYLFLYFLILAVYSNGNFGDDGGGGGSDRGKRGLPINENGRSILCGAVWVLLVLLIVHYKISALRSLINDLKAFVVAPTRAAYADACCITAIQELNKQKAKHDKIRQGWNLERSKLQKTLDDAKKLHRSIHSLPR